MDVDMMMKEKMKVRMEEIKEAIQKNSIGSCEVKIIDMKKKDSTELIVAEAKLLGAFLGGDATIGQLAGVIEQYKSRLCWQTDKTEAVEGENESLKSGLRKQVKRNNQLYEKHSVTVLENIHLKQKLNDLQGRIKDIALLLDSEQKKRTKKETTKRMWDILERNRSDESSTTWLD